MDTKNLLLELGTEELPPKSLRNLAQSLHDTFVSELKAQGLGFSSSKWYATPRRLALFIKDLQTKQADRKTQIRGPAVKAAFDAAGKPTKAAEGWARANGINVADAQRLKTDKGEWLFIDAEIKGKETASLVPELFAKALKALPIPRLMHWGSKREEFIRPVHTLCMLFGQDVIQGSILGVESGRVINGHRFLGQQKVTLRSADTYVQQLRDEGHVTADYDERKSAIISQVKAIANSVNGVADLDDALVEEVTSIVESPHIYKATFEERFLEVPAEALVYTMKGDQKYFPIYSHDGKLLPVFAFASNICPDDPTSLISGNERVIRPRLSDAEFFFKTDRKHTLESFFPRLETIVYQKDIGTLAYRTGIVRKLAVFIAGLTGADAAKADRAAYLGKCDLATTMVTEFTDTQGIMGMHYAELDGEDKDVSEAIFQAYEPRFAGDKIPTKPVQVAVSLAEKITTLVGIMGIGMLPRGDKDPFGLRRAAIGLIRIIIENGIEVDFTAMIRKACELMADKFKKGSPEQAVEEYIYNRLKAYYQDQGVDGSIIQAVLSVKPHSLLDFDRRIKAVTTFKGDPASADLAAAYKRINNILSKAPASSGKTDKALLREDAEKALVEHIEAIEPEISKLYGAGDYAQAMSKLSELRNDIDSFFDHVMVNDKDEAVRSNRLAILTRLRDLCGKTADISVLY